MFAESEEKFFAKMSNIQVSFETGPECPAARLILHKAGRDMLAPRLS
jgi:hypothetical protein